MTLQDIIIVIEYHQFIVEHSVYKQFIQLASALTNLILTHAKSRHNPNSH